MHGLALRCRPSPDLFADCFGNVPNGDLDRHACITPAMTVFRRQDWTWLRALVALCGVMLRRWGIGHVCARNVEFDAWMGWVDKSLRLPRRGRVSR